jgi:ketosteroid isomerase-like protein
MKLTRRDVTIAATFAFGAAALGPHTLATAQGGDEAAVNEAIKALNDAMIAADKAKLEALVSDQLSYGHSAGRIESKAQFIDVVANKKTIYKTISLSDASTKVVGNNAIARHIYSVETESNGKPATARVGVLQVWQKDGGRWQLLARQAFKLPD